ncbi:LysR family transcriptional regulator [Neobacillus mesonae]|nr:LysR family transcriptional regulator [Neobacillus mesonae]
MNLQQLKIFVLTVELKKLYLVAQKMNITQPTVTFHLNKLQDELGLALFHTKSYHVIKLTEAGKAFYHYASKIHALSVEAESAMDIFRENSSGKISIGSTHTPATYLLPPLLSELQLNNPGISIALDVRPASFILDKIKNYELDLGIISNTSLDDDDLIIQPLLKDDLVLIFPPSHPFALHPFIQPADLAQEALICHEPGSMSRDLIDEWADLHRVKLNISMEVSGTEALKSLVEYGLGYGMISESSIKAELITGKLMSKPIPSWSANRQIYAVRHRNKLVTPALRLFWRMINDHLQQ